MVSFFCFIQKSSYQQNVLSVLFYG